MKDLSLVAAFIKARQIIAAKNQTFICYALTGLSPGAKALIQYRLAPWSTCEGWVAANVPVYSWDFLCYCSNGKKLMREYRLRWLDSLIAEFS